MLSLIVVVALCRPQWSDFAVKFRQRAEEYKAMGLGFEISKDKDFEAVDSLFPGRLQISAAFSSPDTLDVSMTTQIGENHSLAVGFGGTYSFTPDGNAKEGKGLLVIEGTGISAAYKKAVGDAPEFETALQEAMLKLGIHFGKDTEGPFSFQLKFGPLALKVDPVKLAKKVRETAGGVGGIDLQVDADAMSAALQPAAAPPREFIANRLVFPLSGLSSHPTLGALNNLEGIVLDSESHKIALIGKHTEGWPEIPSERVATMFRTVCSDHLHPFISIDPDFSDWLKPHRSRVGGISKALAGTSLIASMLKADYSMKLLALGNKHVENVLSVPESISQGSGVGPIATRFWINPAPLRVGDLLLSSNTHQRVYQLHSRPVILTAPLTETPQMGRSAMDAPAAVAASMTSGFDRVIYSWPESGFAEALQDIQLSNLCSVLMLKESEDWVGSCINGATDFSIPGAQVPKEFPAISVSLAENSDVKIVGGMQTFVEIPMEIKDAAGPIAMPESDDLSETPPSPPVASDVIAQTPEEMYERLLVGARQRLQAGDLDASEQLANSALRLRKGDVHATLCLFAAMARREQPDPARMDDIINQALQAHPQSWEINLLRANEYYLASLNTIDLFPAEQSQLRRMACDRLRIVKQNRPGEGTAYLLSGEALRLNDEAEEAMKEFDKAVELSPLDYNARVCHAGLLAFQQRYEESLQELDAAQMLTADLHDVTLLKALVADKKHDLVAAKALAEEAKDRYINESAPYATLGRIEFELGHPGAAVELFTKALELSPKDPFAKEGELPYPKLVFHLDLWKIFTERNLEKSVAAQQFGLKDFDFELLTDRAKAYVQLNQLDEAKRDLNACIQLNYPNSAAAKALLIKLASPH